MDWDWEQNSYGLGGPGDWLGDWLTGRLADWWVEQFDHRAVPENLDSFNPNLSDQYWIGPSTNGHRVYEGQNPGSFFIDFENDGTIDAHVFRDGFGDTWVELNDGQGPRRRD